MTSLKSVDASCFLLNDIPLDPITDPSKNTATNSVHYIGNGGARAPCISLTEHTGKSNRPKRRKLLSIWQYLTLRGLFQLLGQSVGAYPMVYIALSFLISSFSFGMFSMVLKDRIREGYTPVNAPSHYEMNVMREFWNSSGDPMMMIVLLRSKDGGSMLRDEHLSEVVRLHDFLTSNFSAKYGNTSVKYSDFCRSYCTINYSLTMFIQWLGFETLNLQRGLPLSNSTTLSYPQAILDGLDVHIERHLFGVTLKKQVAKDAFVGKNLTKDKLPPDTNYAQLLTNMNSVKVILMVYRGDKLNETLDEALTTWELEAFKFSREKYNNDFIDMQVIGTEILEQAMTKDGQRLTPYFAAGFGFMMFFVTVTVLMSAVFYDALDWGKALVAGGAILCPILSITTTYGFISLLGIRTNSFMLVMPFLIMGIGVDDGFLMIHSWQRLALCSSSVSVRLGLVFEEVGPSITITSLTNFISFGIGALTPTPEIRLFCITTATAMGLDYLYELILFGPILAIATRCEKTNIGCSEASKDMEQKSLSGWRYEIDCFMKWVLKIYCKMIGHRIFTIVITVATVLYWYFAVIGALKIKTRLDTVKILPKDSAMQAPNQILNDIVWADYHAVTVLVNNPFDLRKDDQLKRLNQLVGELEQLPKCRKRSTLLWLRDYATFYHTPKFSFENFFFGADVETTTPSLLRNGQSGLDYDRLEEFLDSLLYSHWRTFLKTEQTRDGIRIRKFWFSVAYQNMSSWEDRIDIMQTWRKIAGKYKDLNVTVWEANGMFVDQMLSLKTVAVQTGILTLICMAVVCTIFIPNPCSVITASIAIASISLGVFGFLSWWGFDLDPVTMAAVLMSIGLSVDFTAHVSYHYQLTNRKEIRNGKIVKIPVKGPQEKLEHTLQTVGWPMIQAGASTVMCVLPLLFLQSYSPIVFLKTIFLVVAWGLLHGLLVLPAFLGSLPDCLTNANCYRTFLSTSSERSCRYAGPVELEGQENEINEVE
ncbi:unnamed protein product [Enterobius vermicularis]|uniref:SSD domain-containing protein n=1 Tax=Enterobius vermicularis TaxID=51028 RepID=A0A0N4UVA0_ENTVE|nr:unnamed protein product [Enterobius vermicularis]